MNRVILMGRLTRDPEARYKDTANGSLCITNYTLAVDRRVKKDGEQNADFLPCVAFGKSGEFAEKYFTKGMRVAVSGRLETGSYTNKDGVKVYTTTVIIEDQEFADSRGAAQGGGSGAGGARGDYQPAAARPPQSGDEFMHVNEDEEDLPF